MAVRLSHASKKLWTENNYQNGTKLINTVNGWMLAVASGAEKLQTDNDLYIKLGDTGRDLNATCTDEREIDTPSVSEEDQTNLFIRVVGGAAGIIHAIEGVTKGRLVGSQIREALLEVGVSSYNHRDNIHGSEEEKVGCGYLGLLAMEQAGRVFDVSIPNVHDHIMIMEKEFGAPVLTLKEEHVAQDGGLLISAYKDKVLNPTEAAHKSFFSLDLGILAERLSQAAEELDLSEKEWQKILVRLTRNNMAACYVLSNGNIDLDRMIIVGPRDKNLMSIIKQAGLEFIEEDRLAAMNEMIEERQKVHIN